MSPPAASRRTKPPNSCSILPIARAVPWLANEFHDRSQPNDIRFGIDCSSPARLVFALAILSRFRIKQLTSTATFPFHSRVLFGREVVPRSKSSKPSSTLSRIAQKTSLISVLGDVGRPSRIPANLTPERVLDAITRAGGPAGPGPDEWVMLARGGR
jgi:hypothetical protein